MAIQMEQVRVFLLLALFAVLSAGDRTPPFKPLLPASYGKAPLLGYPSFVPKHGALKPYMTQFRAGTRLAPVAIRPAPSMIMSLKRPIKSILGHPSLMKQPLLKRHPPLPFAAVPGAGIKHHTKFQSSPAVPSTGELVFEKLKPITTKLTSHKDGAIHTIPAPNLGLTKPPQGPNQIRVTSYEDSNKLEIEVKATAKPTFTPKPPAFLYSPTPAPYNTHALSSGPHQYQVTEEHSNDVTIGDLYSGKKTYFAPDPDPSLPSKSLVPTSDPLSIPSNGKFAPAAGVLLQSAQPHYPLHPQTSASAVIQYVNAVPQASYAIPLATQPQLQQHILQQTAMLQEMPVSLYNPTYLVTQSNNLFNTHQQQAAVNLFKPDTGFLGAMQQHQQHQHGQQVHVQTQTQTPAPATVLFNSFNAYKHSEPAASTGQILSATQDQLHELQSVVNQIQLSDIHNQQQPHHLHQSADMPTYAQLVGHEQPAIHEQQLAQLNQLEQQLQQQLIQQHQQPGQGAQRPMTDAEIANLLNYGMINLHNNLPPSDYYHYQVDQPTAVQPAGHQSFYELSERQKENDRILAQAQQDLYQQQAQQHQYQLTQQRQYEQQQQQQQQQDQQQQQHQQQQQQQQQQGNDADYLRAYQEHQRAVSNILAQQQQQQPQQQSGGAVVQQYNSAGSSSTHSPLRIYVPDGDHEYSNSVNAQKRMDEIEFEYADSDGQLEGSTAASNAHLGHEELITPNPSDDRTTPAYNEDHDERAHEEPSTTNDADVDDDGFYSQNLSNHRLE